MISGVDLSVIFLVGTGVVTGVVIGVVIGIFFGKRIVTCVKIISAGLVICGKIIGVGLAAIFILGSGFVTGIIIGLVLKKLIEFILPFIF